MKPICFEFRLAQARHPDDEDGVAVCWMMEMVGKVDGVGHCIRSQPMIDYPSNRATAMFFSRTMRKLRDWFDSPEHEAAQQRAAGRQRPSLIVVPGRQ